MGPSKSVDLKKVEDHNLDAYKQGKGDIKMHQIAIRDHPLKAEVKGKIKGHAKKNGV